MFFRCPWRAFMIHRPSTLIAVFGLILAGWLTGMAAPVDPVSDPASSEKSPEPPRPVPDKDGKVKGITKSFDAASTTLTITVDKNDFDYKVSEDADIRTASGRLVFE